MSDADQSQEPKRPVIYPDDNDHNADWLRILGERRRRQQQAQQEQPQDQPPTSDQKAP